MVPEDQHAYVGDLRVGGGCCLLEEDCSPQVAARVRKLFIHDDAAQNNDPLEGTQSLGDRLLQAGKRVAEHSELASAYSSRGRAARYAARQGNYTADLFAAIDHAFEPKGQPLVRKPADDIGFGSETRVDGIEGTLNEVYAIEVLQFALDESATRSHSGHARSGRLKDAKQSDAQTLLEQGFTLARSGRQAEAAAAYRGACDKGFGDWLCCPWRTIQGQRSRRGTRRAAALYQQGCDGDKGIACSPSGWDFANGVGVTKDLTRAAALIASLRFRFSERLLQPRLFITKRERG